MLAAKFSERAFLEHVKLDGYLMVQPKIDGMRVLHHHGVPKSRSWKNWTSSALNHWSKDFKQLLHGLDGEMIPGLHYEDPEKDVFRRAMSEVRAMEGGQDFTYYIFDNFLEPQKAYWARLRDLKARIEEDPDPLCSSPGKYNVLLKVCPTYKVTTLAELYQLEEEFLEQDFEGAIVRRPMAPYKYNRATTNEGWLTKLKRFEDAEAVIVEVIPRYKNNNEKVVNELGLSHRSAHQDNLEEQAMVGAFKCRLLQSRTPDLGLDAPVNYAIVTEFNIGVFLGFGLANREVMWARREEFLGKIVKFKHQGYGGGYDVPRTPVLLGFRDPIDL